MDKTEQELRKEGEEIAKKLGNGIKYLGPQIFNGEFYGHLFNDDLTRSTFGGKTLRKAKERLIEDRKKCNAEPPTF